MNIFALHDEPATAARWHCDKHCTKMLLESVQILNGALYERDLDDMAFYGYTHKNHPCTLWAGESWANFEWLVRLTHHLNDEWRFRYDHEKHHTSYRKLLENWYSGDGWMLPAESDERTPFAQAMPDDVKSSDSIQAYRDYYCQYKQPEDWFTFKKGRPEPKWLSTNGPSIRV